MSAATSSSSPGLSALSIGLNRVVVLVGNMGSGKSHFINAFCPTNAPPSERPVVSKSSEPETRVERTYRSAEPGIELMDTVGVDVEGHGPVVPLSLLEGKLVHFVVLLSSTRWQHQYNQILTREDRLKWAQPSKNISKWAAHGAGFEKSMLPGDSAWDSKAMPPCISTLRQLSALHFEPAPVRQVPPAASPAAQVTPMLPKATASHASVASKAPPQAPVSREVQVFGAGGARSDEDKLLLSSREKLNWLLPGQEPMKSEHWRLITSAATVAQHRQTGEKLLELHLHLMRPDLAENLKMNSSLMNVVRKFDLKKHIDSLYTHNPSNGLNDESYANYIEALCYKLAADKKGRKVFVAFLHAVLAA